MALRRTLERVIRGWALGGGVLLLGIVALTTANAAGFTANAVARTWGGSVPGISGYEDAVTLLVGVAALAMFPYCQMTRGHAVVDVFLQKAPGSVVQSIDRVGALTVACIAVWLSWMLGRGVLQLRADAVETAVLGWPVWVFAATAVPSCLLWAVAALLTLPRTSDTFRGA